MKYFDPSYEYDHSAILREYAKYVKEWSDVNGIRALCNEDPLPILQQYEFITRLALIGIDYLNKELEYDQD